MVITFMLRTIRICGAFSHIQPDYRSFIHLLLFSSLFNSGFIKAYYLSTMREPLDLTTKSPLNPFSGLK